MDLKRDLPSSVIFGSGQMSALIAQSDSKCHLQAGGGCGVGFSLLRWKSELRKPKLH